jgi:hypothetical protein
MAADQKSITDRRPARAEILAYELDDDLVLYDERTREGFLLNQSAAAIWQLADGTRTIASLAQDVSNVHGIEYRQALDDVEELMESLDHAGLLAGAPDAPSA